MFESLSDKLGSVLSGLSKKGRLTEQDIEDVLRAVRLALLEADVDFKVVRQFVKNIKEKAAGEDVFGSLTPGQSVVRIVQSELTAILGGQSEELVRSGSPPTIVMMVGLNGAGKTTSAAKLALKIRKETKQDVMLAACDLQRPAAIDQLVQLGKQIDIPVHHEDPAGNSPLKVAQNAIKAARASNAYWLIVDTAGRVAIDDDLMSELEELRDKIKPTETLLVLDALTGQDAVRSGGEFHSRIGVTGMILTKMDGDSRGGAALSMRSATGVPIKFIATGEKVDAFEVYHPDRLAGRILGMGDVASLIEMAEEEVDFEAAKALEKKLRKAEFDLNDLLDQFKAIKKMGSITDMMGMIPGLGRMKGKLNPADMDDSKVARIEAIILSMTAEERRNPKIINGSRRKRIADGSGTSATEVNQLMNQFTQVQKMMKRFARGGSKRGLMGMLSK
ncbi:MAG: signal recognition particle protein [Chloroflexi bacterium]|nr:signal recognition particle protein [Chloroflexota bacterium]